MSLRSLGYAGQYTLQTIANMITNYYNTVGPNFMLLFEYFLCEVNQFSFFFQASQVCQAIICALAPDSNWLGYFLNQHYFSELKFIYLLYARHYKPQFVCFLPTQVHLCTVTFGLMYG